MHEKLSVQGRQKAGEVGQKRDESEEQDRELKLGGHRDSP